VPYIIGSQLTFTTDKTTITYREQNYKEQKTNILGEAAMTMSTCIVFSSSSSFLTILPLPYIFIFLKPVHCTVPREENEPSDV
jgi:hypothetical protein